MLSWRRIFVCVTKSVGTHFWRPCSGRACR
jgi:hypothetical protein